MQKKYRFPGFLAVSLIHAILGLALVGFGIVSFLDYQYHWRVLGFFTTSYVNPDGTPGYQGGFGFPVVDYSGEDPTLISFVNVGGYVFIGVGALLFLLCLISFLLVSVSARNGKTKKGHFVPAIVAGGLLSISLLGLPLLLVSIFSMTGLTRQQEQGENQKARPATPKSPIVLLIFSTIAAIGAPVVARFGGGSFWINAIFQIIVFGLNLYAVILVASRSKKDDLRKTDMIPSIVASALGILSAPLYLLVGSLIYGGFLSTLGLVAEMGSFAAILTLVSIPCLILAIRKMVTLPKRERKATPQASMPLPQSANEETVNPALKEAAQGSADSYESDERFASSTPVQLKVRDFFVSRRDFSDFKKGASEEELLTVVLSLKYQMTGKKALIRALIAMLGAPLSIVLGIVMLVSFGWFGIIAIVAGYLFFSVLGLKQAGYQSSYDALFKRLAPEDKEFVKSYFREKPALAAFNYILRLVLFFESIPYQAIIMFLTTMIPQTRNWGIAKGSIDSAVVAIPEGYDVAGLSALDGYYRSFRFHDGYMDYLDEAERERIARYQRYEADGKTYYSEDGKNFYEYPGDTGTPIAVSEDGGQTIRKNK